MFPGGPDESGPAAAGTLFCKPDAIQADASRSLKSFSYKPRTRPDSLFDERSLSSALRNEAAAFGELDVAGSELPAGADGDSRRMARARKIMDAIRIRSYPVHPALTPFLKCVWSLESDGPIRETTRERILPDSCMELVFHFADPFRSHFANGESAFQPRSFVVGQMKRFLEIEPAGRAGFVAVRFVARGAYLFFHRPLSEVAAGVVDLEDLWSDRAGEWTERVALARDMATRVRLIEEALLGLLRENGRTDPAVDRALQLIETSGGQIRVAELAAGIGVSCRHLTRLFQRAVGLSPKEFGRVSRFLCALKLLGDGSHRSLMDVALACGYFDQAHFNHEFRELAGMTPAELSTFPNVSF